MELGLPLTALDKYEDIVGLPNFSGPYSQDDYLGNQASHFQEQFASQIALRRLSSEFHRNLTAGRPLFSLFKKTPSHKSLQYCPFSLMTAYPYSRPDSIRFRFLCYALLVHVIHVVEQEPFDGTTCHSRTDGRSTGAVETHASGSSQMAGNATSRVSPPDRGHVQSVHVPAKCTIGFRGPNAIGIHVHYRLGQRSPELPLRPRRTGGATQDAVLLLQVPDSPAVFVQSPPPPRTNDARGCRRCL